jgi:hypothetical protein
MAHYLTHSLCLSIYAFIKILFFNAVSTLPYQKGYIHFWKMYINTT